MQGFNMGRYVPPEHEGVISANQLSNKHALGARARKASQGILTVRFEMPFPVWCTTCQPNPMIIGQGVRFNAEKKKVGNYYSTPIYSFRMKHSVCGGWIEIRTDPKNTAYVVTQGAKKRDTGEDKEEQIEGEIKIKTAEERERLERDAFASLEGKVEDKRRHTNQQARLEELQKSQERDWADPYESSRKLRRTFRIERKIREERSLATEALKDKMSLGLDLLDETEEDRLRAGLVDFAPPGEASSTTRSRAAFLFHKNDTTTVSPGKDGGKRGRKREQSDGRRAKLQQQLSNNTRARLDPFEEVAQAWDVGIKRRKPETVVQPAVNAKALVDYDSD